MLAAITIIQGLLFLLVQSRQWQHAGEWCCVSQLTCQGKPRSWLSTNSMENMDVPCVLRGVMLLQLGGEIPGYTNIWIPQHHCEPILSLLQMASKH